MWGNRVRVVFGPLLQGVTKFPSVPPYIQPLGRRLDLGFERFKLAIAATSSSSFVSSDQAKTALEPQLLLIFHLIFAISRLQFLSSCLFFRLLAGIDLRGQVDRASAGSITSRSWFSDR